MTCDHGENDKIRSFPARILQSPQKGSWSVRLSCITAVTIYDETVRRRSQGDLTSPQCQPFVTVKRQLHIHTNSLCCYHKDWVTGRTGFDVEREIPDLSVRGDETDRFYRSQRIFNVCNSHEWLIIKRGGGLRDEQSLFIFPLWSDYGFYLNLIIHDHYSNCEPSIPSLCGGK